MVTSPTHRAVSANWVRTVGSAVASPPPPPAIRNVSADLALFIESSLGYVQSYSEGYAVPTAPHRTAFVTLATALIDPNISAAESLATGLGFDDLTITDLGGGTADMSVRLPGATVTVTGEGFLPGLTVRFGGVAAAAVAVSGAGGVGLVDVPRQ